jgi:ketol-acid reductoisomerase
MQPLYDQDIDQNLIKTMTVAVIGYGNQGAAHAQNLRDSGVRVVVGSRADSKSGTKAKARAAGFDVMTAAEATRAADLIMMMTPDELQPEIYAAEIAPNLRAGQRLGFCHGMAVHFGLIKPRADMDVILVGPKAPGYAVRAQYQAGHGALCLVAAAQNPTGHAMDIALSYAAAIGGGKAGILQTTFRDECETNLFGEQAVLTGGVPELIKAAFDTLVDAGYPAELAYTECLHQTKLLVDLIFAHGIKGMRERISGTAHYGGLKTGARLINQAVRDDMKKTLAEIQSGEFVREWMAESASGGKHFQAMRDAESQHRTEAIGARVRAIMLGNPAKDKAA